MDREQQRVLVVSHTFWPVNVIGAMRPLHVVGELMRKGYEPTVLTFGHWNKKLNDYEYGADIAARVRIRKAHMFTVIWWMYGLAEMLGRQPANGRRNRVSAFTKNVLRWGLGLVMRFTEAPTAVTGILLHGLWLSLRRRPDCVYCSAPSYSSIVGSALLARCLRVPFVADFRDLWTLHEYAELLERHHILNMAGMSRLERFVLRSATRIIYNTDIAKEIMDAKYPAYAGKSTAITNGILVEKASVSKSPDYDGPFVIAHIGSFYLDRDPGDFLSGLDEWMKLKGEQVSGKVVVKLVGRGNEQTARRLDLERHGAVIETYPQKSKAELADILAQSHLLLLCLGYRDNSRYVMSAKVYDYLAAERPIIAYAPRDGEVYRLMKKIGLEDNVVTSAGAGRTRAIIDREFNRYLRRDDTFSIPPKVLEMYDYGSIASRIEQVIGEAIEGRDTQ